MIFSGMFWFALGFGVGAGYGVLWHFLVMVMVLGELAYRSQLLR